jgi:hypothetical protein
VIYSPLGKGEVVSSILTGSTTAVMRICVHLCEPGRQQRDRTRHERGSPQAGL